LVLTCDMAEAVIALGEGIKSYGSDYFEDLTSVSSTGWAYTTPLLLCNLLSDLFSLFPIILVDQIIQELA
jgi:hypothetical protein